MVGISRVSFSNVEKRFQKASFIIRNCKKIVIKDKKTAKNVCSIQKSSTFAPEIDWAMV